VGTSDAEQVELGLVARSGEQPEVGGVASACAPAVAGEEAGNGRALFVVSSVTTTVIVTVICTPFELRP